MSKIKFFILCLTILSIAMRYLYAQSIITIAGRGIKPIWLIGSFLILYFVIELILNQKKIKFSLTGKAIIIFNCIALLSLINLINKPFTHLVEYSSVWIQLVFLSLLFFTITSCKLSENQFRFIIQIWIGFAFFLSLYAIYQVIARPFEWPLAYLPNMPGSGSFGFFMRPSSVFDEASYFGRYLYSPLLLSFFLWYYRKDFKSYILNSNALNGLVFGTILLAFLLTFSMGAYAAILATFCIAFLNRRVRRFVLRFSITIVIILISISFLFQPLLGVNFTKMVFVRTFAHVTQLAHPTAGSGIQSPYAKTSMGNRYKRAKAAFNVGIHNPIIGVSLNNYQYYYPKNVTSAVHNGFLKTFAEMGFLGVISLFSIFVSTILQFRKKLQIKKATLNYPILVGFYYSVWSYFFSLMLVDIYLITVFWITLSLSILSLDFSFNNIYHTYDHSANS